MVEILTSSPDNYFKVALRVKSLFIPNLKIADPSLFNFVKIHLQRSDIKQKKNPKGLKADS